jgi:ureidoglycolate hydrolase
LVRLRKVALKLENFEKLQEVQDKQENPSQFLEGLTKALLQHTNLNPENPECKQLLMTYFFSQSYPYIRAKLKNLERGPLTSQAEVLVLAFKVYYGRDENVCKQKYHILVKAVRPAPATALDSLSSETQRPPGTCYKCCRQGHWAKACSGF